MPGCLEELPSVNDRNGAKLRLKVAKLRLVSALNAVPQTGRVPGDRTRSK